MNSIPARRHLVPAALFLSLFILSTVGFSQDKEWRPVTPEELSAKQPSVEPDADAEAIFWEIRIDDSSSDELALRHYVRVKIFTERGREKFSKFDVPYTKEIRIKDLAARVTKADGAVVEIDKKDIFDREIVKAGGIKIKARSFAVPNIEPGVIVEYRYREIVADGGAKGMRLALQRDIPIKELSYYYKPYGSDAPTYHNYGSTDTKFVKDSKGFWLAKKANVPSFKEEPRMPPEDHVRPWMLLTGARIGITSANMFGITFTIKDPGNQTAYWGAVTVENAPLIKFMNKPKKEIKALAEQITAGGASNDEKLRKLYQYCQTEIRNTSFDTTLTDEDRKKLPTIRSMSDVLKNKSAGSQYVDMLFGAFASALGMDSSIAFTGDRSKMFFKPEMTNESLIHPAAVAVMVDGDWKFFNPGMRVLPYGMLVWYEQDAWALIIGEKNYYWRETPLSGHADSAASRTGKLRLLEDGTLEGTVKEELSGHLALNYRIDNYDESATKREENLKEQLKERLSTAEISEISIENVTDSSKPVVTQYKIRVPNYAQKTGKRLFLQPGFFEHGEKPLFAGASRKYDIFFRFPWSENDKIEIELPKGFELENAEAPMSVSDPSKISSLNTNIAVATGATKSIIYDRKFYFGGGKNVLFAASVYPAMKALFDTFHTSDSHTLTLRQQ